jgi:hypothetical protein
MSVSTNESHGGDSVAPGKSALLHGAHLRTFEALFRHPTAHNLEWQDLVSLVEKVGSVHRRGGDKFDLEVGGVHYLMHKPHAKELSSSEVVNVRHLFEQAGWSAGADARAAAPPSAAVDSALVVVEHHEARIYHVAVKPGEGSADEIRPYDPHHFLHHLAHKDQLREEGQRAPEDFGYYEQISNALVSASRIVVAGHGKGKSNAARHLVEHLRVHHPETHRRIVAERELDLSATTPRELLVVARQALGHSS